MTDLPKRLRDLCRITGMDPHSLISGAAKRIEVLEQTCDRWAAVVEQSHDLNYGKFHVVRREQGWIVYREGRAAFLCGKSFYAKYFPSAGEALDACDELMADSVIPANIEGKVP